MAGRAGGPDANFLRAYRPPPGGFDEMLDADGALRPHYRPLIEALSAMSEEERSGRTASAARYLREAGVFYRVYGGADPAAEQRAWPLAHPPLVVSEVEWAGLKKGLIQRADFLERLLADLYGDNRLVGEGILPAAVVADNPEYLRPLAGQGRKGEPLLRFIAVDLGRGPDGRWWVLGDRTQAPSGAGFALENRVATARAFGDLRHSMKVERLAGFFQRFRTTLYDLTGSATGRVGLLTPGPHNETYFEHAYLARYLGFMLLEGGDLAADETGVAVRTVHGPRPIKVLWRRLDADYADPLELYAASQIGTAGLVEAARAGHVTLVNALGSGILESRALLAFQARMAEALIGETLELPVIATWWCGQPAERDHVRQHRDRLAIAPAFPPASGAKPYARPTLPALQGAPDDPLFGSAAAGLVGQELVGLSTAPVVMDGHPVPRPVTWRVFLARDDAGWHVMPGGFARVSHSADPRAVAMQAGGHSVDVWVRSRREPRPVTLLGPGESRFPRRLPNALPAHAADNLFWLGRYVERAEGATRLLRLAAGRRGERDISRPLQMRLDALLASFGLANGTPPVDGLHHLLRSAFDTASRIRDRFSPDGWRVLAELDEWLRQPAAPDDEALVRLTGEVLTRLSGFAGLVQENMYQFTGWRFLQAGRHLERGSIGAGVAAALVKGEPPEGAWEALLEFTDSRVAYRRRYSVALSRETVIDLTLLDPLNPRSLTFQAEHLRDGLAALPGSAIATAPDALSRRMARLAVRMQTAEPMEVDEAFLTRAKADFAAISELIDGRYFAGKSITGDHEADDE
ncbi:circularly permuted type 2 ATP-grasp protein [Consotaella aegiceratis]|uniref:circularly permuted type 2 ATP-grasp protein n=1 Tax=Consotaella aegiceratis TaxID=3097961 RepID=UPI002F41BC0A